MMSTTQPEVIAAVLSLRMGNMSHFCFKSMGQYYPY